ncbi:hypothetical protein B6S12_09605 [Helicobacter valdiviensis]|uniref:Tetrahaem cytochrome domain-containing protein n=1 Tax=Helicobacter valdiviensis TaxID=1458358 RepID=A0A2W6NEE7_9HELI|nr:cytochrome c3 family protein [Helicobacter valdiviensis]PZT47330.1 hypothetical protein B6S12_09605 [Helicobacter valdiviensis]
MRFLAIVLLFVLNLYANENGFKEVSEEEFSLRNSKGEVVKDFSEKNFPLYGKHKKLNLSCTDCHLEKDPKDYSSAMGKSCQKCHGSYEKLAEYTGGLGHNNNVHKSPHFKELACDVCHQSHQGEITSKNSKNLCATCHGQESMQQLIAR